ncbi:thiol reductant ABC exporter subunit CydD [Pseudomonas syringae]|nr:thiol reductant ABC exporter subunit CydD [Pseudomonas syringae]
MQAGVLAWTVQGLLDGRGMAVVWPAALALLGLGALRTLSDAWGGRLLYRTARQYLSTVRAHAVTALADRSPLDTRRAPSGLAASVLAEQAEALLPYLVRYLPVRQRLMTLPVVIVLAVAWFSWLAALVLLLAAPLIPLFMALVGWRAKAASEAQWLETGNMNAFLLDRLRGLSTLRAFAAVEATAERLQASSLSLRQRTMRVLRIAFLSSAVLELFSALGVALVAVYIGFHLLGYLPFGAWGQTLSLGQGLFVLLLAPSFFEPLRDLSAVWHDRASGVTALQALEALSERGTALPPAAPVDSREPGLVVHMQGVSVRHAGAARPAFESLSLQVAEGEHLAITGPSGGGKSTVLATIAGLLPLQAGHLSLNVAPGAMGWIGQKPHTFAGSVHDNVALGRPGVDRAAVEAALAQACLAQVGQARAGQVLGEGGQGLSGGEAVRLSLARVAADPSVRLILADEPTAHLDRQSAFEVIQALLQLARGRTLIVATHDPVLAAAMQRQVPLQTLCQASVAGPVKAVDEVLS